MIAPTKIKCQVCKKGLNHNYTHGLNICKKCKENPFRIEDLRHLLAEEKDLQGLTKTYNNNYPEIINTNSGIFWDKKFQNESLFNEQDEMTKEKITTIASFIPKRKHLKLLDLGVGKAYLEQYLEEIQRFSNIDLYCLDISKRSIRDLKNKYKGSFTVSDVHNVDKIFNKSYFDVIVALELLEHVPPHEVLRLMGKVHSLLKPNGLFLISTPTNEHLEFSDTNPSRHVRNYTPELITAELTIAGFCIKEVKLFTAFKKGYRLKKVLRKIFPKKWEANNITVSAMKIVKH